MATLTELVDTIAEVEGLDPSSVALIARYIREAGLITTGGRGPSAARMSFRDAAHLVIGVSAARATQDAAKIVSVYRKLEAYRFISQDQPNEDLKFGTLGEAIKQLLAALAAGELPKIFLNDGVQDVMQLAFSRGEFHIALRFRRPDPAAFLLITPLPKSALESEEATEVLLDLYRGSGLSFSFHQPRQRGTRKKPKSKADRMEETTITHRTLGAVAKLLSSRR
jgi:hypothetical protein